jgi:hypothetical protein
MIPLECAISGPKLEIKRINNGGAYNSASIE